MSGVLGSAPVPAAGPGDHVRGEGPVLVEYADYECPFCAALDVRLAELAQQGVQLQRVFRHFPVRSSHPRAWPAACAAEAAGRQGRFWEMHDLLMADQGRLEDPHLWERARRLELDLERFEADRRSPAAAERVTGDFRSGVRGGVVTTPTVFCAGEMHSGRLSADLLRRLAGLG